MLDIVFFGVFPYVTLVLFLGVSIIRYRKEPFTYSSLSSQFLESRKLFWGSVPFHLGVVTLFFGHLIGFLFPRHVTIFSNVPVRLFIIETTALAAALLTLFGLVLLIARRASTARLRVNTTFGDILVYVALLFSIITGLWVALGLRWGSAWYTHTAVPYLWSILKFQPDIQRVAELPLALPSVLAACWILLTVAGSLAHLIGVLLRVRRIQRSGGGFG